MQKILGISSQELRQYQLLQYLFRVKRHHRIDDIRLYEDGVMNPRTFSKLENALHNFEQACLNPDSIVVKKGGSDRWIATFNLSSAEWQIC